MNLFILGSWICSLPNCQTKSTSRSKSMQIPAGCQAWSVSLMSSNIYHHLLVFPELHSNDPAFQRPYCLQNMFNINSVPSHLSVLTVVSLPHVHLLPKPGASTVVWPWGPWSRRWLAPGRWRGSGRWWGPGCRTRGQRMRTTMTDCASVVVGVSQWAWMFLISHDSRLLMWHIFCPMFIDSADAMQ